MNRHVARDPAAPGQVQLPQKARWTVQNMLEENFGDKIPAAEREEKMARYLSMIEAALQQHHLVTVFDIRVETNLDNVILTSLLKGKDLNLYSQLYLALVWDRLDIAEEKIFSNRSFEMRPEVINNN